MSPVFRFKRAWRHFRFRSGRMALSVVAVALGVALVVAFRLMNAAVLASFLEVTDAMAGRADLTVRANDDATFPEEIADLARSSPGVALAVPLVRSVAFPDDGSGEMLTVQGVDLANEEAVRVYHRADAPDDVVEDSLEFLSQPDSVILGRELAERRGLARGDRISLVTPSGVRRFTVRGLLAPEGLAGTLRGRLVVMDLPAAQRAFAADGRIHQVDVLVDRGSDVDAVRRALSARLPTGLRVEEPVLRKEAVRKTVDGFQAMITAFSLLSVLAGFVICYSRLATVFEARSWEIGLMRAVGLSRSAAFAELLKEAVVLAAAGVLLGLPAGVLIAHFGLPALATATAIAFRQPVPSVSDSLALRHLLLGAAVGLAAAIGAAAAPALRLSRREPVAALTMRGRELPEPPRRRPLAFVLLPIGVIGLLLALQSITGVVGVGYATTLAIGLAACLLSRPLVVVGGRAFAALAKRSLGAVGGLSAVHLRQQVRGTSLAVATLGVGLGALFMFGMLGWSFERTLVAILVRSLRADLIVSSAFVSGGYWAAPLDESLADEIRGLDGVLEVGAEQSREVAFRGGAAFIKSFDPAFFERGFLYGWPLDATSGEGALARVASGEGVLVTRAFAHAFQVGAGDRIEVDSPTGPRTVDVVGVSAAPIENAIIMSRLRYREWWSDPTVSLIHVAATGALPLDEVERRVRERVGERYRIQIRRRADLIEYFASQVRKAFGALYLMEAILFLLVVIAIGDALATGVIERTRELGMMRAVGMTRRGLFGLVVAEGAMLGVLGLALALATGIGLGWLWVNVQFPAILGWKLDAYLPARFMLAAGSLALVLVLLASVLPGLRAAFLAVPTALRNE